MASAISFDQFFINFHAERVPTVPAIGGVGASPANFWAKIEAGRHKIRSQTNLFIFVVS